MTHITAGDVTPVTIQNESTYGTPTGAVFYYGEVAEGGNFTFKDTPNPYINWRYGSRSFDPSAYVTQQKDAAFSATLEVIDLSGWSAIITNAVGIGGSTASDPLLPSRTEDIMVKLGASDWRGRVYNGCKTDKLTIKADAPGGIVQFTEDVMAMKGAIEMVNTAKAAWTHNGAAVQWLNGITVNGTEIYPQSFELSIANNLDRVRGKDSSGNIVTLALLEGRREIELKMDVWMEDLTYINNAIDNSNISGSVVLVLGKTYAKTITLSGCKYMADGQLPSLIQDKQKQTIRIRAANFHVS